MKSKKQSQANSKKRPSSLSQSQITTDEDINELIADITLKRGRNAFCIYISEMYAKEKATNESISLMETVKKYCPKYGKLSETERSKYQKKSEEEREKYKKDLETVKHFLFSNYVKKGSTAYRIFLENKLKLAFENEEDPKEVKIEAAKEWKEMSAEERREWNRKKKENDDWWEKAKHSKNVNGYCIFVQKKIAESKDQLTFKDVSEMWKKTSEKDKRKYQRFADEINEERRQMREIYEIYYGIKPKRPAGAFRIFLTEKAKEGKFHGKNPMKECKKLWDNLSDDDKDKYLKLSHRIKLCYIYRKMLYKKSVKKVAPSKPKSAYNIFVAEMKGKKIPPKMTFMEFVVQEWDKLDDKAREKYDLKAEKSRLKYEKEKEKFSHKIFEPPKKPKTSYQFYIAEKVSEKKENDPKSQVVELLSDTAKEWNDLTNKEKKKYEKASEKDRERYELQMEEFKKNGFYTDNKAKKDKDESSASQSKKRKSQKSQSTKKRQEH